MTALSKHDLEQMLQLLDLSTLESVDRKYHNEDPYTLGHVPLLTYTSEALAEYAGAIYHYILPRFGLVTLTEAEYIALWLAPYTNLKAQLQAKSDDFIGTLVEIVSNPIPETDPHILITPSECLYAQIADFLSGRDNNLSTDALDFICNAFSPLRKSTVTDQRVLALVAEIDAMRDAGNKALAAYIGSRSDYSWQTEEITGPKDTEKVHYKVPVPSITYGKELKRLKKLINERLAYHDITSENITLLTAHKALIPVDDWAIIAQAFDNKVVTANAKKLIAKYLKTYNPSKKELSKANSDREKLKEITKSGHLISAEERTEVIQLLSSPVMANAPRIKGLISEAQGRAKTCLSSQAYIAICKEIETDIKLCKYFKDDVLSDALSPYKLLAQDKSLESGQTLIKSYPLLHAVTININEVFINSFLTYLESAYTTLTPESIFDLEDSLKDVCISCTDQTQEREQLRAYLINKGFSANWFEDFDFTDIRGHLLNALTLLFAGVKLNETPEHGAITGMYEFASDVKKQIYSSPKALNFDFAVLAKELRTYIQFNTLYANDASYISLSYAAQPDRTSAEYAKDRYKALKDPISALVHMGYYGITKVTDIKPFPEVTPISKELLQTSACILPSASDADIPSTFDLTILIKENLKKLQPTHIFTNFHKIVLPDDKILTLKPVPDPTIEILLSATVCQPCTLMMQSNGDLYGHITATGEYLKLVRTIGEDDGYADYIFTAINWDLLTSTIASLQHLVYDDEGEAESVLTLNKQDMYSLEQCETQYYKAVRLFKELADAATVICKGTDSEAYAYKLAKTHYYDTYFISQHRLVAWIFYPQDYKLISEVQVDAEGNIIKYQVDHIKKGREFRCYNHPENLRIVDAAYNIGRTSRSIEVDYNGNHYVSVSSYCDVTNAGSKSDLLREVRDLQPGDTTTYGIRTYTMHEDRQLTATDIKQPEYTFNGVAYPTKAELAKALKITPEALRKQLSRAKSEGKTEFMSARKYKIVLSESEDITVSLII